MKIITSSDIQNARFNSTDANPHAVNLLAHALHVQPNQLFDFLQSLDLTTEQLAVLEAILSANGGELTLEQLQELLRQSPDMATVWNVALRMQAEDAAPTPPAEGAQQEAGATGEDLLAALQRGDMPSVSNSQEVVTNEAGTLPTNPPDTTGNDLLAALARGDFPAVSDASQTVANQSGQLSVTSSSGNGPASGSAAAAPTGGNAQTTVSGSTGLSSGNSASQVTSQMSTVSNLGMGVQLSNASLLVPFVQQTVGSAGNLVTEISVPGATTYIGTSTTTASNGFNTGSTPIPVVQVVPPTTETPVTEPPVPVSPNGTVTIALASGQSATIVEGTGGAGFTEILFTLTRSNTLAADQVPYTIAGIDLTDLASGGLTGAAQFAAGQNSASIAVRIRTDAVGEATETLTVTLSDGQFTAANNATASITIQDDDQPTIAVSNAVVSEDAGQVVFTVSLSNASASTMSFVPTLVGAAAAGVSPNLVYSTDNGTTWVSATAGATISAGATQILVRAAILDNEIYEGQKNFSLVTGAVTSGGAPALLTNPAGASGTGTIRDDGTILPSGADDDRPSFSVSGGGNVVEGQSTLFTLSLNHALSVGTEIELSLGNGTTSAGDIDPNLVVYTDPANPAGSALSVVNGRFTLPPGVTAVYVKATTIRDALTEGPESFSLTAGFTSPALKYADGTGANPALRPGASATDTVTITDPITPNLSVSGGGNVVEGQSTIFTVGLDKALTTATEMELSLGNITTSASDLDPNLVVYTDPANPTGSALTVVNGRVTLPAGVTAVYVKATTVKDSLTEGPESFSLSVGFTDPALKYADGTGTNPTPRAGSSATDTVTITDVPAPNLSVSGGGNVVEGQSTIFTVTLDKALTTATEMELSLGNITTSAGDLDPNLVVYTDPANPAGSALSVVNGRFTLPAGVTSVYVKATTVRDTLTESPESFSLSVGFTDPTLKYADGTGANPTPRAGSSATDNVTITDVPAPNLSVSGGGTVVEGQSTIFTVGLDKALTTATEMELSLGNGTTSAGDIDPNLVVYTDPANPTGSALSVVNGRVTLPAGVTAIYVKATTVRDALTESPESFSLNVGFTDPALKYADGTGANPTPRAGSSATDTVTITDPVGPQLSVSGGGTLVEGQSTIFTVGLDKALTISTDLELSLGNITTAAGDIDPNLIVYTDPANPAGSALTVVNGRVTLPAGVTTLYVKATTVRDALTESPESFSLTVGFTDPILKYADGTGANPTPRAGSSATDTVTITDPVGPQLSVSGGGNVVEGQSTIFTVALDKALTTATEMELSLGNITTAAGDIDPNLVVYTDPANPAGSALTVVNGRVTLPAGVTALYVKATTVRDTLTESPESFSLTAGFTDPALKYADGTGTNPTLRAGSSATDIVTITDPITPNLSVSGGGNVVEGRSTIFTVGLDKALTIATEMELSLANITTAAGDIDPTLVVYTDPANPTGSALTVVNGRVTLPAGVTSLYVKATTVKDTLVEKPESFSLTAGFTDPALKYADGTGTNPALRAGSSATDIVTVTDPVGPQLSVTGSGNVVEGQSTIFTVALDQTLASATDMELSLAHITSTAGDINPNFVIYTDPANPAGPTLTLVNGHFTLPAGVSSVYVKVTTLTDKLIEKPESFSLSVGFADPALKYADGTGASPTLRAGASATDTTFITDPPDLRPTMSVGGGGTVVEGGNATFTLSLDHALTETTEIDLSLGDITTSSGDVGTLMTIYTNPNNIAGSTLAVTSGRFTLPAGVTTVYVLTSASGDLLIEQTESFSLTAGFVDPYLKYVDGIGTVPTLRAGSSATNTASITDGPDTRPSLSVTGVENSISEGTFAVFTVALDNAQGGPTDINLSLAHLGTQSGDLDSTLVVFTDPTDINGSTLTVTNGSFTLPAGVKTAYVRVATVNDLVYEGAESFQLTAGFANTRLQYVDGTGANPALRQGASGSATATIIDDGTGTPYDQTGQPVTTISDDDRRDISISSPSIDEGATHAVFTVTLSVVSTESLSFSPTLTATGTGLGHALPGTDMGVTADLEYSTDNGTTWLPATSGVTIPPGSATVLVRVPMLPDNPGLYEGPETFQLETGAITITGTATPASMRNPEGVVGTGTIYDDGTAGSDDDRPTLSIDGTAVLEDAEYAIFTVHLDKISGVDIVFTPTLSGTITPGSDTGADADLEYYDTGTSTWLSAAAGVTIAAGDTSVTIRVPVIDDVIDEGTETILLGTGTITGGVTNPSGATATGTITDNDPSFAFQAQSVTVTEGETMNFVVQRVSGLGTPITLDYSVVVSSTDSSTLPTTRTGTVSFGANDTQATITLASVNDQRVTDDQSFYLSLSTTDDEVWITQGTIKGTVKNDDADISIQSITATGPDSNGLFTYTVTVVRSSALGFSHAFDWTVAGAGENPAASNEFTLPSSQHVVFTANADPNAVSDTQEFTFKAAAGLVINGERAFDVRIAAASDSVGGIVLGREAARGIITPTGAAASIETVTTGIVEGSDPNSPQTQTFRVNLSQAMSQDVVVQWRVESFGSNTLADANAADFGGTFPTGTITIAAGQTSGLIQFAPSPDSTVEPNEKFYVDFSVLSGPAGKVGPAVLGRILNDEASVGFTFSTVTADEGDTGANGHLTATVARADYIRGDAHVDWHVEPLDGVNAADILGYFASGQDGAGTHGGLPSGTLTIGAGYVQGDILVELAGNNLINPSKYFRIVLDNPTAGTALGSMTVTNATVLDDDAYFEMGAATLVHEEGQSGGTSIIEVIVNRVGDTRLPASVNWSALGSGTYPTNATDLQPGNGTGTVLFGAGESTARIQIHVRPDDNVEQNEQLTVTLTGTTTPHHHVTTTTANQTTTVTLNNDDSAVSFDSGANLAQSLDEDGSGHTGAVFTFTVTRSGDTRQAVSVPWSIPLSGDLTVDDFAATSGNVTFGIGVTTATITVTAVNDRIVETSENFSVVLAPVAGSGVSLGEHSTATGTLVNDDVSIQSTLVSATSEGAGGATSTYTYTLTRVGDTARQASDVNWSVAGTSVVSGGVTYANALSAGEIASTASGNVTWNAGDTTTRTVTVTVNNDTDVEGDEAFALTLSNNGSDRSHLAGSGLVGIVHDDDATVSITRLSPASVIEGAGGTSQTLSFRVTRMGDLSSSLTVDLTAPGGTGPTSVTFNTESETATISFGNGQPDQVVQILGGEQSVDVSYTVQGDNILETGENFTVTLSNPQVTPFTGRVADATTISSTAGSASVALTNDDDRIAVTASQSSVLEGDSGSTPIEFTLTRTGDTTKSTIVNWRVLPGTGVAVNGDDFATGQTDVQVPNNGLPSGRVTFAAGETSKTVTVNVLGDTLVEGDENLLFNMEVVAGNTELADTPVTILTDDVGYAVSARADTVTEGNDPSTPRYIIFDVTRDPGGTANSVDWALSGGILVGDIVEIDVDGVSQGQNLTGSISFTGSQTTAVVRIKLVQDMVGEATKTATLTITDPSGTPAFTPMDASVSLVDDDSGLSISAAVSTIGEGTDTDLTVTDTRPAGSNEDYREITFTVARTGKLTQVSTADWAVLAQNGVNATDFVGGVLPTGSLTFAEGETSKTITVRIVSDWQGEADEDVTVQLSNASAGTGLITASAVTTVTNDDALVSFTANLTEGTALSHAEGDSGYVTYSFTVTRSGSVTQANEVSWRLLAEEESGIDLADFYDTFYDDPLAQDRTAVLPYGTVAFAANETSKTIEIKVKSDNFAATPANRPWPPTVLTGLEADEPFTIELFNPATKPANVGVSVAEDADTAHAIIANDDVRIQVVSVTTSLPEGRAPTVANGYDVNPFVLGQQDWVTHTVVVKRTGDLSEAVSFEWFVDDANFANQMLTTPTANVSSGSSGILSWAAGDGADKVLYFTAIPDDTPEDDYSFDIKVRPNNSALAESTRIDEFSAGTDTVSTINDTFDAVSSITLGKIVVKRDEAEVWISNDLYRGYNAETSRYDRFGEQTFEVGPDTRLTNVMTATDNPGANLEGSVVTATAGTDYTATSGTLSFDAQNRTRTVTVNVSRDSFSEQRETFSLFLDNAGKGSIGTDQTNVTLIDGDGTDTKLQVNVVGSTAIEGVDTYAQFRIDFGGTTTRDNVLRLDFGGTAFQDAESGKAGDYFQYVQYSTDSGLTWKTTAPKLEFDYTATATSSSHTQTVQYQFNNSGEESFSSWLDFTDLKAGQGYKVGGGMGTLQFSGVAAPPLDTSGRIYVVVEANGAWIDTDNDGVHDSDETTKAFDDADFASADTSGGNMAVGNLMWKDLINLASNAVTIKINDLPSFANQSNVLDLRRFGEDDEIVVDIKYLAQHGYATGTSNITETTTNVYTPGTFALREQTVVAVAERDGVSYTTTVIGRRVAYSDAAPTEHVLALKFGTGAETVIGKFGEGWGFQPPGPSAVLVDASGFTDQVEVVAVGAGTPAAHIWVPVRADAVLDTNALGIVFGNAASAGSSLKGSFLGVADLLASSTINDEALLYFQGLIGDPDATLADIQTYFHSFGATGMVDTDVKFLHFVIEWDGTGSPTWGISGLDAALVVAPQDGNWVPLQLQQDITVAANATTTAADVQLSDRAALDDGTNSLSALPPSTGTLTAAGSGAWDGTIAVGPGVDSVLVRTALVDDAIDEVVEKINVTVSHVSGDDFDVAYGAGTVTLVDDDSPQITMGANVVHDITSARYYVTQTIDINNRSGDTPDVTVDGGGLYVSTSQNNNAGTDQSFTIVLRYQGTWEAAPISEILESSVEIGYGSAAYQHSSPPAFKTLTGTPEMVNGAATGFYLYEMTVPAGTLQVMMRSQVEAPSTLTLDDLTDDEQERAESLTAVVGHVDPIIVARNTSVTEADGRAQIEVVAVGGDFNNGAASVDYSTVNGAWVERTFVVSRELGTVGAFTLQWAVESPDVNELPAGAGDGEYVNAYYPDPSIGPTDVNDFVALSGQTLTSSGVTGTVSFADGQKEAYITVRVRSDNIAEVDKDFRVKLVGEVINGTLIDGTFDSVNLVANPEQQGIYSAPPLSYAGYGRISNDDRTFTVVGVLVNEAVSSVATLVDGTWVAGDDDGLGLRDPNGTALASQGLVAPTGYTLHQFVVTLEGVGPGAASVDWSLVVNGIDGSGGFIEDATSTQAAGAHRAETADFLLYDGSQGAYDSALGLTWGTPNGNEIRSDSKTLYFANGVTQKVVTVAIRNDLLAEDAEEFEIVLSNPQALEGSLSPVGVDALRGSTKILIADDDGSTVKVELGWKDGTAGNLQALSNNASISEGTGPAWDFDTATPTSPNTDDDKRLVITFTRSAADATASQAFFEIDFGSAEGGGRSGYFVESGNISELSTQTWRGIVDFAAGATTAQVILRVADDNLVEEDNQITVTLYDAEYLPTSEHGTKEALAATAGWDVLGIGKATGTNAPRALADWNTTRRDPTAYTASVTVKEDDVRLWFTKFSEGAGNTTYGFDDDRDPSTTATSLSVWDPRARALEGDAGWSGPADQQASTANGDFNFTIVRDGNLVGDVTMAWEIVLDGTATADDFNSALFSGSYVDTDGNTRLVGQSLITLADGGGTVSTGIAGLFVPDLGVENDETFHLVFKTPVSAAGDKVLFSPNSADENDSTAQDGRFKGRELMTIGVTIGNDDVVYSIAWNAQNANGEVLEADATASSPNVVKFDVSRLLDTGNDTTDGYIASSTVGWRVVPKNGSDITPEDFFEAYTQNGTSVLPFGTVTFSARDPNSTDDILKTVELRIRGDAQVELGEHFTIELYNPSIGHIDQAANKIDGVIINDDTGLRVENVSVSEGDSGDTAVTVTVTRTGDLVRAGKPQADQITGFNWSVFDVDTNGDDRGTGSFSGTGVQMGDGSGETTTVAAVYGYAEETTTLTFNVKGDAAIEADETLSVLLANVTGVDQVLNNGAGTVTVLNDDTEFSVITTPTYETANNSVVEDAGGTYHFRITRTVATPQNQTVTWSVVGAGGRNVVDATDFGGTLPSGTVTFTGNELYKDITFSTVSSDGTVETDEVFLVEVSAFGTGAENDTYVATGTGAKGTIINDDASVFISDSYPITQQEGTASDVRTYRFEIVRAGSPSGAASTVDWALDFTGTGADASDFTGPTSGTVNFTQDGVQLVTVTIAADAVSETALQNFNILLTNESRGVTILTPSVQGIIGDDDYELTVANASVAEGDGNNNITFTVTRTGSSALAAPVSWSLDFTGKTASAADFRATTGTFIVPAGVTSYTFNVPIQGDTQWEDDESFTVNLSYSGGTTSATGTLTNDDEGFSLATITDVAENSGPVTFRINREGNLTGTSSVNWAITGSGTNPASTSGNGNDFAGAVTGTASFADNEAYIDVTVNLAGDTNWEQDETYTVTLSNPSAGSSIKSVGGGTTTGKILNDDQGYSVTADVTQITENQSGNVVVFTVTRGISTGASTVKWALSTLSGDANALAVEDLLIDGVAATSAANSGTVLSFANGETSKTVTVTLVGDSIMENPANLRMTLTRDTGDTGSTLLTPTADVQVVDDDEVLSLVALSNPTMSEGNSGLTQISFKVTRTGSAIGDASATLTIAGKGEHPLTADDIDHIVVGGQTLAPGALTTLLTFANGVTADQQIDIFVKGDTVGEFDEKFTVTLSNPVGETTLNVTTLTQTVLNDDPILQLVMGTTTINEGNDGDDRAISFQVTRGGDLSQTATVTWSVLAGTTNPVDAADFGGFLPTGLITFQAGESQKTVTFATAGDEEYEPNESFKVVLSNATGATIIGPDSINATLANDDVRVTLAASNSTVVERHGSQTANAQFTLTAQGLSTVTSTLVTWHVEGTGLHPTNAADFSSNTLPSGQTTVNMTNGSGTATITIDIAGDNIYGPDEQFRVVIDSVTSFDANQTPGGGSADVSSVTVTVLDDDILIGLSQTETHRYVEDDSGTTEIRFYVDQIERSTNAVMMDHVLVDYHVTGDVDADDITGGSGTGVALSWDSVEERYYIGVTVKGDTQAEGNERFELHLDAARADNYNGGVEIAPSGTRVAAQILDDDFGIALVSPNLNQAEDGARFVFDVLRTGQTDEAMTVQWSLGTPTLTGNEQGVSANDFLDPVTGQPYTATTTTPITGTITFTAGQSTARFTLEASHDLVAEATERFAVSVEVTEVGGIALAANSNQIAILEGSIINDETLPPQFDPTVDHVVHPVLDAVV